MCSNFIIVTNYLTTQQTVSSFLKKKVKKISNIDHYIIIDQHHVLFLRELPQNDK